MTAQFVIGSFGSGFCYGVLIVLVIMFIRWFAEWLDQQPGP